jgi:hypothetical protein
MGAPGIPLPPHAHLPGVNARPDAAWFAAVKAACPPIAAGQGPAANPAWIYGLQLLNAGYFWEAHEVLEPVWMNATPNSRERHLVQALIHLANAALKLKMGRRQAAGRIAALASESLGRAFARNAVPLLGLKVDDVSAAVAAVAAGRSDFRLRPLYA